MSVPAIPFELYEAGIYLDANDQGQVRPRGPITSSQRARILERVEDIAELVRARDSVSLITDVPKGLPVGHREVYAMTAQEFVAMPAPSTLWLEVTDFEGRIAWTTHRPTCQACLENRTPVFVGGEVQLLALGTREYFTGAADFKRWCELKGRGRFRVTPEMALGASVTACDPDKLTALPLNRSWPLVAVLALLDARLVEVEVHDKTNRQRAKEGRQ